MPPPPSAQAPTLTDPPRRSTPRVWLALITLCLSVVIVLAMAELAIRVVHFQREYHQPGLTLLVARARAAYARDWASGLPRYTGRELNRMAYEATYLERGLPLPQEGPREGFWGQRVDPPNRECGLMGTCSRTETIPGLVDVDEGGYQVAGQKGDGSPHIVILGASVAYGSYASTIQNTYFAILADLLATDFPHVRVSVFATGGLISSDEVAALAIKGLPIHPDVVVFLDGLNDLVMAPPEAEDLPTRVRVYLRNMKVGLELASAHRIPVLFALQPFLGGKKVKSPLERRLLQLSWPDYEAAVNPRYAEMASGLRTLVADGNYGHVADLSGLFDGETKTTFADQWHFGDPGHRLLAEGLRDNLVPILRQLPHHVSRGGLSDHGEERPTVTGHLAAASGSH